MFLVCLKLKTHFPQALFFLLIFKLVYFKENLAHVFLVTPDSFALNASTCCFAKAVCFPSGLLKSCFVTFGDLTTTPFSSLYFLILFYGFQHTLFVPSSRQVGRPLVGKADPDVDSRSISPTSILCTASLREKGAAYSAGRVPMASSR